MLKSPWVFLVVLFTTASPEKIPKQLQLEKCDLKADNVEQCLGRAIEAAIPKFKNGVPALGVPKLDPLMIPEMVLHQGNDKAALNMNLKLKNVEMEGTTQRNKFLDFKFDKRKLVMTVRNVNTGPFIVKGRHNAKGRLLTVPIDSDGDFKFELYDIITTSSLQFKESVRKGIKYWDLVKLDYDINEIGRAKLNLTNLIRGNKALDESLNQSIRENWKELEPSFRPAFSKAIRVYYTSILQRFFRKVPLDEIINGTK